MIYELSYNNALLFSIIFRSETDLSNYKKQQQRKSVTHDSNINKITPVEQPEKAGQNDLFMLRYWKSEDRNTEKNEFPANNKNNNNVTTQMRVPPPSIVVPAPSPRNNEVQDRYDWFSSTSIKEMAFVKMHID